MEHRLLRRWLVVYCHIGHAVTLQCFTLKNVHAGGSVAATPPFCRGGTQTEEHDEEGYQSWFLHGQVVNYLCGQIGRGLPRLKWDQALGPSPCPQSPSKEKQKPVPQRHVQHWLQALFFVFDPTLSGIWMVRLFVIPSGAARSPNHDSAPQGSASVPPPPVRLRLRSLAPAPAPAACSCSAPARTVLIQGGALHIFSVGLDRPWLRSAPSKFPDLIMHNFLHISA